MDGPARLGVGWKQVKEVSMRRATAVLLASALFPIAQAPVSRADNLLSLDSPTIPLSENFDSLGNSSDALLPSGWVVGLDSSFAMSKSHTDRSAGTSGGGALTINSRGGFYNLADGENLTSTDRAVGFLSDAFSVRDKNLMLGVLNNTGTAITELHFSYDIEKYRTGIRATDLQLQFGTDGMAWSGIPQGQVHYAIDSSTAVINPPTTANMQITLSDLNIPYQSAFYLRWIYGPTQPDNCQVFGIDNFQLSVAPIQSPDLQWDGGPGATWDAASTNWKNNSSAHVSWNDNIPNNAN